MLDFAKVKPAERQEASRLFRSAVGKLLAADAKEEAKTLAPEEGEDAAANPMAHFTPEQREQVGACAFIHLF